jgi:hypothetical protein
MQLRYVLPMIVICLTVLASAAHLVAHASTGSPPISTAEALYSSQTISDSIRNFACNFAAESCSRRTAGEYRVAVRLYTCCSSGGACGNKGKQTYTKAECKTLCSGLNQGAPRCSGHTCTCT